MSRQLPPLHVFPDVAEFVRRHKAGTEAEFAADQKMIDQTNKEDNRFQAWVLSKTRQTTKRSEYVILVQPGADGERKLPQQGEPAKLRLLLGDNTMTRFWEARRIESPLAFLAITARHPEKLAAFQVTVYLAEAHSGVQPLIGSTVTDTLAKETPAADIFDDACGIDFPCDQSASEFTDSDTLVTSTDLSESGNDIRLTDGNAVGANFLLTASEATKNSELNALELLCGRHVNASERQIKAFEYFVLLRDPEFYVDLHEQIPHLIGAMREPSWSGSPLARKFALLNPQQRNAYLHGFRKLHCGICILPGGPGAGKTHFNLFTIAMAQSRVLPRPVMVKGRPEWRRPKVLFIIDMNSPVDDVANRAVRLFQELGLKISVIRMKGWGTEVKLSDRLNSAEDAASGDVMAVDFTNQFLRTANLMSSGHGTTRSCFAPSLDEAAWERYDEYKSTKYEELTRFLEGELWEHSDVVPLRFRRCIYNLYRDTLGAADFIATTPVAASNHFNGMFKPDLVFFDESPHARELCNLIAIANFDPMAWIFCGDYRQTVPYVGSTTSDCDNIYRDQMQVSMMERAAASNVIGFELLMNHRSFGGLHQLASTMWYGGRMVSGNEDRWEPEAVSHIRDYLGKFMGGRICTVPRLLVHINKCGPEAMDGTSSWNPTHTKWVMARVLELLYDDKFRHAERDEPGTILIISPYKKAYQEYKNALKTLPQWAQHRVETRTVDVVQGHEADFVFLDLVKAKSTKFLDNPNRLCVAVTRARIGEVIMMHPDMVQSTTFLRNSRNLRPIYQLCWQAGQVVRVDAEQRAEALSGGGGSNVSAAGLCDADGTSSVAAADGSVVRGEMAEANQSSVGSGVVVDGKLVTSVNGDGKHLSSSEVAGLVDDVERKLKIEGSVPEGVSSAANMAEPAKAKKCGGPEVGSTLAFLSAVFGSRVRDA